MDRIDRRTLNRATMTRQWLAERQPRSAAEAVTRLVGVQAQEPHEPYTALWSRLVGFAPAELVGLLESRAAVRTLMMRRTLHLLTAEDCRSMRPVFRPMLGQRARGTLGPRLPGLDWDELAALGEPLFAERPRILSDVGRAVAHRFPEAPVRDLGDALSTLVPLVQVPPRGLWGIKAPALNTTITAWLGDDPVRETSLEALVLRYLAAYGPAASADVRSWSGLTGLPAAITRLRPNLRTYRDERGRELLDLADVELPDPDLSLPPRFVPAFDNVVLGYDDRSRVIDDEHKKLSILGTRFLLADGRVSGAWTTTGDQQSGVTVTIETFRRLSRAERGAVTAEALELASFLGDGVQGRVSWAAT